MLYIWCSWNRESVVFECRNNEQLQEIKKWAIDKKYKFATNQDEIMRNDCVSFYHWKLISNNF